MTPFGGCAPLPERGAGDTVRAAAITRSALAFAVCGILTSPARAISLGQVDDFQDGTTQEWLGVAGQASISDGGLSGPGDLFLDLSSTGEDGPGGSLFVSNTSQWQGDYTSAGVEVIRLDLANLGPTDLQIRLVIESLEFNGFVTQAISLAAGAGWATASFSFLPADLTPVGDGSDVAMALATVNSLALLHAPTTDLLRDGSPPVEARLGIDRICAGGAGGAGCPSALLEPPPLVTLLLALAALSARWAGARLVAAR